MATYAPAPLQITANTRTMAELPMSDGSILDISTSDPISPKRSGSTTIHAIWIYEPANSTSCTAILRLILFLTKIASIFFEVPSALTSTSFSKSQVTHLCLIIALKHIENNRFEPPIPINSYTIKLRSGITTANIPFAAVGIFAVK